MQLSLPEQKQQLIVAGGLCCKAGMRDFFQRGVGHEIALKFTTDILKLLEGSRRAMAQVTFPILNLEQTSKINRFSLQIPWQCRHILYIR